MLSDLAPFLSKVTLDRLVEPVGEERLSEDQLEDPAPFLEHAHRTDPPFDAHPSRRRP